MMYWLEQLLTVVRPAKHQKLWIPATPLSRNFTLGEMTRSATATRAGVPNTPDDEAIAAMQLLCEKVLQPARDANGALAITSGYRSPRVNRLVKGSRSSDHKYGKAADLIPTGNVSLEELGKWIQENCEFKQLIYEYEQWLHVSFDPDDNRCEILEAYGKHKYRTHRF
jgi:zinc D-Ala-D-Ala carboxypeptidase